MNATSKGTPVLPTPVDPVLIDDLVAASRILAEHGVVDAYGHVSMRHPTDPGDRKSNRMSTSIAHVWGVSGMHTGDCWVDFSKPVARDFSV